MTDINTDDDVSAADDDELVSSFLHLENDDDSWANLM